MEPATDPAALFHLGNKLLERDQAGAAVAAFRACLAAAPDHAATHYNLANALLADHRPVQAAEALLACLRLDPHFGAAYLNLASTLRRLALLDQARSMAERAVAHLPAEPEAKICLAAVLHDRAEYAAAATLYRQALDAQPAHAGALSSLGNTLAAMGQLPEALAVHDRAVAAEPGNAEFRFSRSTALLAAGAFGPGWDEYEWRWRRPELPPRAFGTAWCGEDIAGRTILLHAEQGLGDTLQFVRYAPMVAARGARVVLEVQPPLVRLLQTVSGVAQVVTCGDALPSFSVHCPLLSLPRAFATRLETIPARPYLSADPVASARWRAKLPRDGGLLVGLVWAGSPHTNDAASHLIDRRRSLALAELAPLAELADVHLVSLQKDPGPQTQASLHAARPGQQLIDLMPGIADFADTAALVANLDLVISVDTAVAHLAAGLGQRVWLLSRYDGSWRWLHGRTDSPWYPSMSIYRQARPNDWSSVVDHVRSDLAALARQRPRRDGA